MGRQGPPLGLQPEPGTHTAALVSRAVLQHGVFTFISVNGPPPGKPPPRLRESAQILSGSRPGCQVQCVSIPGPVSRGERPAPQCLCPLQRCPEPAPRSAALCPNPAMARDWAVTSPWGPSSASNAIPAMPCRGPQKSSASLFLGPWPSGMSQHQHVWVSTWTARTRRGVAGKQSFLPGEAARPGSYPGTHSSPWLQRNLSRESRSSQITSPVG